MTELNVTTDAFLVGYNGGATMETVNIKRPITCLHVIIFLFFYFTDYHTIDVLAVVVRLS